MDPTVAIAEAPAGVHESVKGGVVPHHHGWPASDGPWRWGALVYTRPLGRGHRLGALGRVVAASRSREKLPSGRYPGARHLHDLRRGYLFYFDNFAVVGSAGLHDQLRTR